MFLKYEEAYNIASEIANQWFSRHKDEVPNSKFLKDSIRDMAFLTLKAMDFNTQDFDGEE